MVSLHSFVSYDIIPLILFIFFQTMSHVIDIDSDGGSDETDLGEYSQSLGEYSQPNAGEKSGEKDDVGAPIKRNLTKAFNAVAKRQANNVCFTTVPLIMLYLVFS
jgi:hypothetical protein